MSQVSTYYLETKSLAELKDKDKPEDFCVYECEVKQFQFNKFLYQFVGAPWQWTDKTSWSDEQWAAYVQHDNLRTWVAYVKASPAGYFELQQQADGDVEIIYFGLAEAFIGQGYGAYLLSEAIKLAWAWPGTKRVWAHTCSQDHPAALGNYKARGMSLYREEGQ